MTRPTVLGMEITREVILVLTILAILCLALGCELVPAVAGRALRIAAIVLSALALLLLLL